MDVHFSVGMDLQGDAFLFVQVLDDESAHVRFATDAELERMAEALTAKAEDAATPDEFSTQLETWMASPMTPEQIQLQNELKAREAAQTALVMAQLAWANWKDAIGNLETAAEGLVPDGETTFAFSVDPEDLDNLTIDDLIREARG